MARSSKKFKVHTDGGGLMRSSSRLLVDRVQSLHEMILHSDNAHKHIYADIFGCIRALKQELSLLEKIVDRVQHETLAR